jgi:hypothetical protein
MPIEGHHWNAPGGPYLDEGCRDQAGLCRLLTGLIDELAERYGPTIAGFWLDGGITTEFCDFPRHIHHRFPEADADCGGTSGEFLTNADAAWQEKTLTIAAADVPAAPCVLTLVMHPTDGQLGTDDFVMLHPWLEVTRKCLTV